MTKKLFYLIVSVVALCTMNSCGSDDSDNPVDIVTEDSWISRICNTFSLNINDYYDYWGASGYDNKVILANGRKADDKIYVAVYDTIRNDVIYKDAHFDFLKSMEANYYEDRYTYSLTGFYPIYCENDEGFVIVVNAHYGSEKTMDAKFLQKIIFNNGSQNFYLEKSAYSDIIPYIWYKDSYLLRVKGNNYADCYNDKGQLLYQNLHYPNDNNTFPISYTEYIDFGNNSSLGKFQIGRKNATNNEYEWIIDVALVEDASNDTRVTYTYESQSDDVWTFICKMVARDGTIQNKHIHLNVQTGEYTIT